MYDKTPATSRLALIVMIAVGLFLTSACSSAKKTTTNQAPPVTKSEPKPVVVTPEPAPPKETQTVAPLKLENVYFDYDKSDLRQETRDILANHARALKQRPEAIITIEGHCDERGTIEYNLALGEKRAKAVKDYLASLGVDRARLSTISFGKERPLDTRHSEMAWSKNRRAQFIVRGVDPS